jgi:hypothetical protein
MRTAYIPSNAAAPLDAFVRPRNRSRFPSIWTDIEASVEN